MNASRGDTHLEGQRDLSADLGIQASQFCLRRSSAYSLDTWRGGCCLVDGPFRLLNYCGASTWNFVQNECILDYWLVR